MLRLKSRARCKYLKSESICQLLYFRKRVARARSKLYGPCIFPSLVKLTRLACLQPVCSRSLDPKLHSSLPSLFIWSGPAHRGPTGRCCSPFPLGSSSRSPMHSRGVAVTSNEHFCRVTFSWIRFLHYTLWGPPWHLIQAIITSEEWYKRDLPLKAFLWYLTAVHQTHQTGRV